MKIRVNITNSLVNIINIERFPKLLSTIFDDCLNTEFEKAKNNEIIDNNYIHGLLELLNCLVEKYSNSLNFDFIIAKLDEYSTIEQ